MAIFAKRGEWFIDYYVAGRRMREKIGPSKKLAEDVLCKRKLEIAEGKFLDKKVASKITFKELANFYMEEYSKKYKASWESHDQCRLNVLSPVFGNRRVEAIMSSDVDRYLLGRLHKDKVSARTVNMELGVMKAMINWGIEKGLVKENPIQGVKRIKKNIDGTPADRERVRFLTKDEYARLLEHCGGNLRKIIILAVNTGLRKSEIRRLSLNDIDFSTATLTLLRQKNGEISRVPLNQTAIQILLETKRGSTTDEPFNYNFRKAFETVVGKAKIKDFRFHDLRHTFASWLVMEGVDIFTVKELMRHKSIELTMRYSHLSPAHKAREVCRLDKVVLPVVVVENEKKPAKNGHRMDTFWTPNRKFIEDVIFEDYVNSFYSSN
ncbi:MAG: hypothetical protein A3G33_08205 [Omnitrophica bacterium RIFCSPLOWO2_12_FULL_44_17]|uniref:Tyr recombinase domain-containing protein n=1 Tax=Candidatus Danuiimicrobium aquiferis TaxID=1801832 RepID=A0A1G1KW56_9BACT|nr:MAG: hypothetical protein A3B72_03420 [Omnitrophica bacterium RIFCSPHIGHO2_02_FULL_45_28]OGW92605.1 MAG: hypothetical protein A3E74_02450 [Omnitrophica bacterium RIFCSPHIGHO2_12_FULL_44_12]OGW97147.1 MAG: hypothetical protein A3G33_08205 [Omnitrophica bacterium RIFCSPLOWO2_12_FULL_44_17]OGX02207.1 MAG: hypothetical protein A3J12_07980 [Omnitrophica bacterium RIFCSPLOWO2_02_FULL_44_11]